MSNEQIEPQPGSAARNAVVLSIKPGEPEPLRPKTPEELASGINAINQAKCANYAELYDRCAGAHEEFPEGPERAELLARLVNFSKSKFSFHAKIGNAKWLLKPEYENVRPAIDEYSTLYWLAFLTEAQFVEASAGRNGRWTQAAAKKVKEHYHPSKPSSSSASAMNAARSGSQSAGAHNAATSGGSSASSSAGALALTGAGVSTVEPVVNGHAVPPVHADHEADQEREPREAFVAVWLHGHWPQELRAKLEADLEALRARYSDPDAYLDIRPNTRTFTLQ